MEKFCKDVDLLKYEPAIFNPSNRPSQILSQGNDGTLNGTTFTSPTALFNDSGLMPGHVIHLHDNAETIEGYFEIVSVDSQTQLTISVVRSQSDDQPIAPSIATLPNYAITTYDPQIEEASDLLMHRLGIYTDGDYSVEDILNPRQLQSPCVYAVLAVVYATMAQSSDSNTGYWTKSHHYHGLLQLARNRILLDIDTNDDGLPERLVRGDRVELSRE